MSRIRTASSTINTADHRTVKVAPKRPDDFYNSPAWRRLMAEIITERGRQCQQCGRTNTRMFGDHIIELKDGGAALDKRNVKCLCGSCHTKKTSAARARRLAERY